MSALVNHVDPLHATGYTAHKKKYIGKHREPVIERTIVFTITTQTTVAPDGSGRHSVIGDDPSTTITDLGVG